VRGFPSYVPNLLRPCSGSGNKRLHQPCAAPDFDPAACQDAGHSALNRVFIVYALQVKRGTLYLARRIQVIHAGTRQAPPPAGLIGLLFKRGPSSVAPA
jgi:hypothetical protein